MKQSEQEKSVGRPGEGDDRLEVTWSTADIPRDWRNWIREGLIELGTRWLAGEPDSPIPKPAGQKCDNCAKQSQTDGIREGVNPQMPQARSTT